MHAAIEGGSHKGRRRGCKRCHAAYMRGWRKTHPVSEEERRKDIARSYAREYKKRGLIEVEGCERCGKPAEMHHDDYSKPLQVRWLCRPHHMAEHGVVPREPVEPTPEMWMLSLLLHRPRPADL